MGMPKCLNSARVNFQTCGCAIRASARMIDDPESTVTAACDPIPAPAVVIASPSTKSPRRSTRSSSRRGQSASSHTEPLSKSLAERIAFLRPADIEDARTLFAQAAIHPEPFGVGMSATNAKEVGGIIAAFIDWAKLTSLLQMNTGRIIDYFRARVGGPSQWSKRSAYRHHKGLQPFTEWCHQNQLAPQADWAVIGKAIEAMYA